MGMKSLVDMVVREHATSRSMAVIEPLGALISSAQMRAGVWIATAKQY